MTEHEHFLVNTVGNGSNNNQTDEVYDVPVGELTIKSLPEPYSKEFSLQTHKHAHTDMITFRLNCGHIYSQN